MKKKIDNDKLEKAFKLQSMATYSGISRETLVELLTFLNSIENNPAIDDRKQWFNQEINEMIDYMVFISKESKVLFDEFMKEHKISILEYSDFSLKIIQKYLKQTR